MDNIIYINGRFLTQKLTGVQRFAYEMMKRLIREHSSKILVLIPPKRIDSSYDVTNFQIKIIGKLTNTLWEQIDLPLFLIKNNKSFLINLVNTAPAFYKNQIVSILDMTTFVNPKWFSASFARYYKLIVPLIAKNSIKVITISENSKADIIKYLNIPTKKIDVIYCGIADQFTSQKKKIGLKEDNIISKLNLINNDFILAVSSLDPRKNFKRLIEAYNLLDDTIPLIIVGAEGKVFADEGLRELVLNNSRIIFTGYVNDTDLIELYKNAKCFVYASLYEGFGMPPLEAMACGCATIVSNTSSMPEVCGDASLYVDPIDVESIKTAISKLTGDNNLREDLIGRGFEQVKKYSWESSAKKLIDLIEENIC